MQTVTDGTYGRIESDHFAFCVPVSCLDIEKRIECLGKRLFNRFGEYKIIVKYGIYVIDDINISLTNLLDRNNLVIKKIKGNFLFNYAYYSDDIRQQILKNHQLLTLIPEAIEKNQFKVYLQPVYDCVNNEYHSAEALVRWMHPQQGMISPGAFIPLAEESGLITKIDYYVWEEACKTIRRWLDDGKKVLPISVNVSRMNIYRTDIVDIFVNLINKYEIDPFYLRLEITESAYILNETLLIKIIGALKDKGFIIMMDDFGSGYSSLNMLKNMPIDILKIDREFIGESNASPKASRVITSVINMAKAIGIPCVAEGVETAKQFEFLCEIGCDYIQGFYFSKPISIEDFDKTIIYK